MKKMVIPAVASVLLFAAGYTQARNSKFTGEIFDSQCAKAGSHEMMEKKHGMDANDPHAAAMCTRNCVKMGGKYVLYNAARKTIYQLDNQRKPAEFAGQKVRVTGTYDKATKTIHVVSIEAAS